MKINYKKNYGYEEYFINDSHMKKLYNSYIHKNIIDKILDGLVLFSLIIIVMSLILEFLIPVDHEIILVIESFSIFILAIFSIELYRDYLKSKNAHDFFSNHWVDFILIIFLSFYFIFVSILGFLKLLKFEFIKIYFSRLKHIKVLYDHLKAKIKNKINL